MEVIYKANDGTIFNDEDECRQYEQTTELIKRINSNKIQLVTNSLKKVDTELLSKENLYDIMCHIGFFYCADIKSIHVLDDWLCLDNYCKPQIFYYRNMEGHWVELQERIEQIETQLNIYKKVKDMLKKIKEGH